jgi:hypothetical protein
MSPRGISGRHPLPCRAGKGKAGLAAGTARNKGEWNSPAAADVFIDNGTDY